MKPVAAALRLLIGLFVFGSLAAIPATAATTIARTTSIPKCAVFVDAANAAGGAGTLAQPHATIAAAIAAAPPGAVICVAEGTYAESLSPGEKYFTLAGGFQRGSAFAVRDSAKYVTRAQGKGGSFVRFEDPSPSGDKLVAIDGFEITGYAQAIFREFYESQRFDITNNFIHGNSCADQSLAGAGFALNNVSGNIRGNVIQGNACGRGGAGFINDTTNKNTVLIEGNLIDGNAGTEPGSSHGGALYLFVNRVTVLNNTFTRNSVTQWGAGLYVGAYTEGGQQTFAAMAKNVYRGNKAGNGGGGFFCDDGATSISTDEVYEKNCGGNILLDGGSEGSGPTTAKFERVIVADALEVGCSGPGTGVRIDKGNEAPDNYTFANSVFRGNAKGRDFTTACEKGCNAAKVTVSRSKVQTEFANGGIKITFEASGQQAAAPERVPAPASPAPIRTPAPTSEAAAPTGAPTPPTPTLPARVPAASQAAAPPSSAPGNAPAAGQRAAAAARGSSYMGFPERFNRYYTDPAWKPSKILFVSPQGSGSGATRERPMPAESAVKSAKPGTMIYFLRGSYEGCFQLGEENSGTYDDPVVLYAERNADGSTGVSVRCCTTARATCFNLEAANYVAVDGFELIGGRNGVRTVGADLESSQHARGVAVLGCHGHDQTDDPFMSGHSDWAVWERNLAYGATKGRHGFYISNGSDWNIVRLNEAHSNQGGDLDVDADPTSGCGEAGIKLTDPRCDAYAGEGEGGRGASDYFLIDSNFIHGGSGTGSTFRGLRRSIVRNNIFGAPERHNVTFSQDTKNPKLASSDNKIVHNLFVTSGGHAVKFDKGSTRNEFANNVLVGVTTDDGKVLNNPKAVLMEVDTSAAGNTYRSNLYGSGQIEGRTLGEAETVRDDYAPGWFEKFSLGVDARTEDFSPAADAPFLGKGAVLPDADIDRDGKPRSNPVDLGPLERQ